MRDNSRELLQEYTTTSVNDIEIELGADGLGLGVLDDCTVQTVVHGGATPPRRPTPPRRQVEFPESSAALIASGFTGS